MADLHTAIVKAVTDYRGTFHPSMKGKLPRSADIDLGLAILASTSEPPHTCQTIAAYCGCSRQRIQQIEQKALRKLRGALYRDRILGEAFEDEFQGLSNQ
jgi:sigma-70-like protein